VGGSVGQVSGTTTATLTTQMMPAHTHAFAPIATGTQEQQVPSGWLGGFANGYAPPPTDPTKVLPISPATIATAGSATAHSNMQPYLCINFAIALAGIYPSRN
jgi:microcystin-dependent protein